MERMSDEEFEEKFSPKEVVKIAVVTSLWAEAKRARDAELKLSLDNKFHVINRDDATTIIADLEKENAELKEKIKDYVGNAIDVIEKNGLKETNA